MAEHRILNLGAGVGSTTVFLLARLGLIEPVEAAVFADTQEEPRQVYEHLQWLQSLGQPRVIVATAGKLGEDLIAGCNAAGKSRKEGRFTSIPAFTAAHHDGRPDLTGCDYGRIQRQCTRDYKIDVVERVIRRELLGLKPRQKIPASTTVVQLFGLDDGEAGRIRKVKERFARKPWARCEFPLARLGWTRERCVAFLREHVPHETPRSACTFCPFRSNREWLWLRQNDPAGWARAVEIDQAIRDPASRCASGLRQSLYLHRSCVPLPMVNLEALAAQEAAKARTPDMFALLDCGEGMCGT